MKTVNVHQAETTLSQLLTEVERGEDVAIARNGHPVARLTALTPAPRRVAGSWRAWPGWETFEFDPSVFAPMTEEEMAQEGWP